MTGTMAADLTKTATSVVTFESILPDLQTAGIHPRIGMVPADVAAMRTKVAVGSSNVAYTQGVVPFFAARRAYYDAHFCWTGGGCGTPGPKGTVDPSSGWIDTISQFNAIGGGPFETDTALYALMALIDPMTGNRATWAAHARDLSMWEMNEICFNAFTGSGACVARSYTGLGGNSNAPFIGSQYIMNNRAQGNTLPQIQAIDMNYTAFSTADKATIAKVAHIWGAQLTGANPLDVTDGIGEHVIPVGAYNTPSIISLGVWQGESGSNNYAEGHFQTLVGIGLLLDPADDPVISSCASSTTTICASDGTTQTVAAYGVYAVKGWLYRLYANFEDQHIVNSALGLSDPFLCPDIVTGTTPCTGNMSGGFTSEGTGYGALSMSMMFPSVYALYTAGKLNPATDIQASFISSSYWDKMAISFVHQLYSNVVGTNGAQYTQFGNDQNYATFVQSGILFNSMMPYDAQNGNTWRLGIEKWYQYNALYGGYANFFGRFMGSAPFGGGGITLLSPNIIIATSSANDGDFSGAGAPNPTPNSYDPRNTATLPLDFENLSSQGGMYRYYGRDNWTTTATQFQFGCNTAVASHAMPSCGRFDFLRKGEPLTTAVGGSSNNDPFAQAPQHQNIPGYQWNPAFDCVHAGLSSGICAQGGMVDSGQGISSSLVLAHTSNSNYYYGSTDASGSYNTSQNTCQWCTTAANVNLSQREVLWLKPDQIFIYDRAETTSSSSFKNWNINLQAVPTVSGNVATMTSTAGQKLFVTSLLPGTSSLVASALDVSRDPGTPAAYLLVDTASTSASVRMLHILEGKDSGTATASTLVQSIAGTHFDGGVIGTTLVMFKKTLTDSFSSVIYSASGGTTQYVAGLAPNTSYAIAGTGTPASAMTDSAGLLTFAAAGTGNITIGSGSTPYLKSITVTPSANTLGALSTQQFAAMCSSSDGSTTDCTSAVSWSSSAMGIVTIASTGIATGVAQGNANVIATSGGIQGQAAVTVPAATLQSITVTPGTPTVALGATQQFKVTGIYSNLSTTDLTTVATWSSSNTAVASVNAGGLATAVAQGNANIIAKSGSVQGQASVSISSGTPIFSPVAGTYTSAQTVIITTGSPSAAIYYTTDGTTPTPGSALYTGPIAVAATQTVKAIATAPGLAQSQAQALAANGSTASGVSSAAYTITLPAAAPTFSIAAGTYTSAQTVAVSTTTPSATIFYTTNGSAPTTSSPVYSGPITVSTTETLQVIATATSYSSSAVGSATYTITLASAAPAFSVAAGTYTSAQTVAISTTTMPSATIFYTTNGSTPTTNSPAYSGPITVATTETLKAIATATGYSTSPVSSAAYTITLSAAAPAFSVAAGTYTSAQTVAISTTMPSATIFYTTNGSTPTTNSPAYSGPITVATTETLKAIATATGYSTSPVSSAAYTITLSAAAPAFSVAAGTYTSAQTVVISTTTPSATIFYTTNGSTPTTSSPAYSGPITVSTTETLQAIATATGYSTSAVGSAAYTITLASAAPAFSVAAGTYTSAQTVAITTTMPSATIFYTTDGSTPTTGSAVYSGPITVATTETLKAIATAKGYSTSAVSIAAYTVILTTAAPTFNLAAGTYTSAQTLTISAAPQLSTMYLQAIGATPQACVTTIYYTTDGSTPTTHSLIYSGPITVSATEMVKAIAVATGYSTSAVNSAAYTITSPVAAPTFSPVSGFYATVQTVTISTGAPSATIHYTTDQSKPTSNSPIYSGSITVTATTMIKAIVVTAGSSNNLVGSASYVITDPAATPVFSPGGGVYSMAQIVSISTTTPAAAIHYTIDGTAPRMDSRIYSGPITVAATETIRAIAVPNEQSNPFATKELVTPGISAVSSASYTLDLSPAATPTFSLLPGVYTSTQTLTINTKTLSAAIYFTTDGSNATSSSQQYSGPITVAATETVKAIAVAAGHPNSDEAWGVYLITPPAATPTFSPSGGTYKAAQKVKIFTATPLTTIYYTTDGTIPSDNSPVYYGPINVMATQTVRAIAVPNGRYNPSSSKDAVTPSISAVGSAAYTMDLPTRSFAVALYPASISIIGGHSGTTTVSVTPENGFASAVSFSCAGLPEGASCNFSPATITPDGAIASTALTVTLPSVITAVRRDLNWPYPGSALALTLCCFGRKKQRRLQMLLLVGVAAGLSMCTGCGVQVSSTPSSISTVAVVATSGSLQPATSLTLTVQ